MNFQTMEVHLAHLQETIEKYENLQQKYQLGTSNSSAQEEVMKAQALLKEAECAKTVSFPSAILFCSKLIYC